MTPRPPNWNKCFFFFPLDTPPDEEEQGSGAGAWEGKKTISHNYFQSLTASQTLEFMYTRF